MPASSGGSITLRLAVAGSEEVKAALASLGPAGRNALQQIEAAQRAPTAGMRALDAGAKDVMASVQAMGARLGPVGGALSAIGPGGIAAAAGIGAMVAAGAKIAQMAIQTGEWAKSVQRFAEATGQSTTAVQQWDFVAAASGIPIQQMRGGIEGVGKAVGTLMDNLSRGQHAPNVRVFEAILGTEDAASTGEKLRQLGDLSKIMPLILDYAAKLTPLEREGLSKVFHIDPETLDTLIDARSKTSALLDEMQRFGLVIDATMIKKSAEASDKMREAGAIMQGEMRAGLIGLEQPAADAALRLAKVTVAISDIARGAGDAISPLAHFLEMLGKVPGAQPGKGPDFLGIVRNVISSTPGGTLLAGAILGAQGLASAGAHDRLLNYALGHGQVGGTPDRPPPKGDNLPTGVGGGGGRGGKGSASGKDDASQIAARGDALAAQGAQDEFAARKRELTAELELANGAEARVAIQKRISALDAQSEASAADKRMAEAAQQLAQGKISQSAYDQLRTSEIVATILDHEAEYLRDRKGDAEKRAAIEKQAADLAKEALQAQIDMLKAQLPLAATLEQRRALELSIFDQEEAQKEAGLQLQIDTAKDPDTKAALQTQLSGLIDSSLLRRQGVINSTAGPWDDELQKMAKDVPSLTSEWQTLAADGVERFNADLFDAQGRVKSLGEVFQSVMQDMLRALEQYLLRQAEIGLFGNGQPGTPGAGGIFSQLGSLFGGSGSGASVISSEAFNGGINAGVEADAANILPALPGFAGGGRVYGRGTGRSDDVLIRASPGERVMNFDVSTKYGPMLDALNAGRPVRIAHFAGGGAVGGGSGGGLPFVGDFHYHDNRDMSISAPGADPAQLQRVIEGMKARDRNAGNQWVAFAQVAGVLPKPRRR